MSYEKLDPKVKRDWVKALRSGKYKQGEGRLHDNEGGFCCLGVLCDIAVDAYWIAEGEDNHWVLQSRAGDRKEIDLPYESESISSWELDGMNFPTVSAFRELNLDRRATVKLANMNDEGKSFERIANWIEKNL